ncbi:MAG TPA: hypothetical protein PKY05_17715, partial [Fibrobacteria bacterium]|nr:hypothetical protein [Fibrobacteria bacterium]
WPEDKVLEYLTDQKGKHFDPDLVDCFLGQFDEVRRIQATHQDTEEDFKKSEALSSHLSQDGVDQAA